VLTIESEREKKKCGTRECSTIPCLAIVNEDDFYYNDDLLSPTALVAGCSASAVAAMLAFGVCFYR